MEKTNIKMLTKREFIGSRMPNQIKDLIRPFYTKLTTRRKIKIDKELLQDIVEYHNETNDLKITFKEAVMLCKLGKKLMADLWNIMDPRTSKEVRKYYEICPYGLFELVYAHGTPWYRGIVINEVLKYSSGKVLNYGGGIGHLSLILAKKGLNVTYVDVQSVNMQFAKWLFEKYSSDIEVLDAENDQTIIWGNNYDTILCIATIEHVLNPKYVIEKMCKCLNDMGRLIITDLENPGSTAEFPFHREMPFNARKLLNSYGIFNIYGNVWLKTEKG